MSRFARPGKGAVIFEDEYRNTEDGPQIPRQSTTTRLTVSASGGPFGGSFSLTTRNLEKLSVVGGSDVPTLPTSKSLEPFETYSATFECEGTEASDSEGDVEVSGVFVGGVTASVESHSDSTTVVKVELEAVYIAPENSSQNRHVYGVGEQVKFTVTPALADVKLRAVKGDTGDLQTRYDTFGGQSEVDGSAIRTYTCPIASTNYTGRLSHDYYAGAGNLHPITDGNYWMTDDAGRDIPYDNWFAGRMRWKIPIGWVRRIPNGGDQGLARDPDYERWNDRSSRPLLIGGTPESYLQIFAIDAEGTASVEKFGYRLERSRWSFTGEVIKCQ